jgi:hypothetical protein
MTPPSVFVALIAHHTPHITSRNGTSWVSTGIDILRVNASIDIYVMHPTEKTDFSSGIQFATEDS